MPDRTEDPKVDLVLQSVETIVASEGGTLELVKLVVGTHFHILEFILN